MNESQIMTEAVQMMMRESIYFEVVLMRKRIRSSNVEYFDEASKPRGRHACRQHPL